MRIFYSGLVGPDEVKDAFAALEKQLDGIEPGFRLLTDLSRLESMDAACAPYIGAMMDLLRARGVEHVVRVVPDSHKDIGLNILSFIHYGTAIRQETYENLEDALQSLN